MVFNSDRVKAGIHTGLVLAANHFVEKMKAKIGQVNVPSTIGDKTSIGSPMVQGDMAFIDITIDLNPETGAPMAAAFEYGSGIHGRKKQRYPITPTEKEALAFPWEVAENLSPSFVGRQTGGIELTSEKRAVLSKVMHPGVAARPFIRPTIQETKEEIKKILGREFKASISLGGIVTEIK